MTALLVALLLGLPPPPTAPMARVTICQADGGDCRGMGGSSSGGLTDAQLRAAPILVYVADAGALNVNAHAVSVSNFPATQAISAAALPLPNGAATDERLTTAVTELGSINTKTPALVSGRVPVDVPTHGVTGTFWQATQPISGTVYAQEGSAVRWSCFVQAVTATTQCQATPGAGQRLYVTSVACSNGAATVQGVDVVYGTGTNCATGLTALTHKFQMGTNGLTTSPFLAAQQFFTPLVPPQAVAVCLRPTAATAFGCTLTGFTAP